MLGICFYTLVSFAVVVPVDSSTPSVHTPLVAEIGRLKEEVGALTVM